MQLLLLSPAGLAALVALAVPVLVHLLLRRRARRMPFPSLRFIPQSNAVAVRLRAITDWPLLAVRCAIVAAGALAVARPLLITPGRREAWDARTARAVVVDVSPSAGSAAGVVDAERGSANYSTVIAVTSLDAGVVEAVRWLKSALPARRELVVISDFQLGVLDPATLDRVPESVGVRLRQIEPSGVPPLVPDIRVTVHAPDRDRALAEAALRAAGQGGTPTQREAGGSAARSVAIYTRGAATLASVGPLRAPWMATVAASIAGVRVGATGETSMAIILDAPASSFDVPRTVRAVHRALLAPEAWRELEPDRLPERSLTEWSRPAPPIAGTNAERSQEDDSRWLWLAALTLIGVETWMRRRLDGAVAQSASEEAARAA
jgi:hypothetical protein